MLISPFARFPFRLILLVTLSVITIVCIVQTIPSTDEERYDNSKEMHIDRVSLNFHPSPVHHLDIQPNAPTSSTPQSVRHKESVQSNDLTLPSLYDLLPHLRNNPDALRPSLVYANHTIRRNARLVIGVPTVPRDNHSYLLQTLQSLAFGLDDVQQRNANIVIMIGSKDGADTTSVKQQISLIESDFKEFLDNGFFHIIVPPREWYPPDLDSIEPTLGDPPQRMYWRTKQNLDYMFLLLYCQSLGEYYLQVEDDILAKEHYMDRIINFINEKGNFKWFTAEFASLGFIGKLFHTKDLLYLINYIALLYRYKPVDWILDSVFMDRYCLPFEKAKPCYKRQKDYRVPGGTLFQHIGIHSSLEGKIQKLKEKNFGQSNTFSAHTDNPKAVVNTSLKQFKEYGNFNLNVFKIFMMADRCSGPQFRRPLEIISASILLIKSMSKSVNLKTFSGFIIRSGNPEHPDDKFDNRTVVLTKSGAEGSAFEKLCTFNERGIARHHFAVPTSLQAIRLEVQTNYSNWLLLSELHIRHS
ncbi:unnamed protein product [Anisakis simplex]|uniref:Protein LOC152586 (inferred by orthology to a human protein) n=1 Tax=Anisakis simplex TaxID=6269 RepID=A0A0M3JTJ7_ANISI|nr:unnamed protein product [Anisakis simplex]